MNTQEYRKTLETMTRDQLVRLLDFMHENLSEIERGDETPEQQRDCASKTLDYIERKTLLIAMSFERQGE